MYIYYVCVREGGGEGERGRAGEKREGESLLGFLNSVEDKEERDRERNIKLVVPRCRSKK